MMKYVIHVSLKFSEVSRFGKWPFMLVLLLSLAEVWPAVCWLRGQDCESRDPSNGSSGKFRINKEDLPCPRCLWWFANVFSAAVRLVGYSHPWRDAGFSCIMGWGEKEGGKGRQTCFARWRWSEARRAGYQPQTDIFWNLQVPKQSRSKLADISTYVDRVEPK